VKEYDVLAHIMLCGKISLTLSIALYIQFKPLTYYCTA